MKIKSLHIKNFKSIVDLTINEPNPFTVFVGPNGSGKSNIFEALEFNYWLNKFRNQFDVIELFGGQKKIKNTGVNAKQLFSILCDFDRQIHMLTEVNYSAKKGSLNRIKESFGNVNLLRGNIELNKYWREAYFQYNNINRIFISNTKLEKMNLKDDYKLSISCSNLENVLKRLLKNKNKREEILEWINLFVPEFENIEVYSDKISGQETLLIKEKHSKIAFDKSLISDGTFKIIALLTAVYQSDEPQFLCIEEPENGLNPYVIRKLVDFFRNACAEKGHYIWLNTHSQTLVECLQPEEIIVVDKINGETQIKQIKGMNLHGLDMAEVWLSGALGGGTPW